MDNYNLLLNFIVLVKIFYLIVISINFLVKFDIINLSEENEDKIENIKEFVEDFYFFLMGIVIIIKFRTNQKVKVSHFEQHLFYLFGLVLCFHLTELFLQSLRDNFSDSTLKLLSLIS